MKLIGTYNPFGMIPCFCIPVFADNNELYVQILSDNGIIKEFTKTQLSTDLINKTDLYILKKIGDSGVYAFRLSDAKFYVCPKVEMQNILRLNYSTLKKYTFLSLDVAEFLGDTSLRNEALSAAAISIQTDLPDTTLYWYSAKQLSQRPDSAKNNTNRRYIASKNKKRVYNHHRHNNLIELTKGQNANKHKLERRAREAMRHSLKNTCSQRREKKCDMRHLWITRLNAAARSNGITYAQLIASVGAASTELVRKAIDEKAPKSPIATKIVKTAIKIK